MQRLPLFQRTRPRNVSFLVLVSTGWNALGSWAAGAADRLSDAPEGSLAVTVNNFWLDP